MFVFLPPAENPQYAGIYAITTYICPLNTKTQAKKQDGMQLSRVIFWDTDFDSIDWDNKARYVIERVVQYGDLADWRAIQKKYGMDRIRDEMLESRDLDPKTLSFLSVIFDIPQDQFRCYNYIRSNPKHWDY